MHIGGRVRRTRGRRRLAWPRRCRYRTHDEDDALEGRRCNFGRPPLVVARLHACGAMARLID